ncbi:MAG: CBS domain-containing protein [Pseudomonadota bacterium]|nr:MAG: CBS domain-containing protein [Pseudomonadota bacterium]
MPEITQRIQRDVARAPQTSMALEAARLMSERFIGSVVVTDETGRVRGLFTERDLMKRVVGEGRDPAATPLKEVMRTDVVTVSANESVERCLDLMRQHRTRHLMVFDDGEFRGLVSLRDLVLLLLDEKEQLIQELTHYINSEPATQRSAGA